MTPLEDARRERDEARQLRGVVVLSLRTRAYAWAGLAPDRVLEVLP